MDVLLQLLKQLGVEDGEKSDSVVELVAGMVAAETEKGKEFYRKKDGEAKGLRDEKNAMNEILTKLGIDPATTNVDEYLSSREKETSQKDVTLESLKEALEGMKGELQSERDLRIQGEKDSLTSKALAELTGGLNNVYGSKHVIKGILADNEVRLGEDGGIMLGESGIGDFVSSFLESNPDIVKAEQQSGSGDRQQFGGEKDFENMSTLDSLASVEQ